MSHVYLLETIDVVDACVASAKANVVVAGRNVVDNKRLELAEGVRIVYTGVRQFVGCNLASQSPVCAVGRIVNVEVDAFAISIVVGTGYVNRHLLALCHLKQRCNKLVVRVLAAV